MPRMTKKHERKDYTAVGDVHIVDVKTGYTYWVEVLVVMDEVLSVQGPLAVKSRYDHNKQNYGPFMVRVHVDKHEKKEHRRKKKKQ